MNRTLKRPMFRIGGSAGTGITSGLDVPRKGYKEEGRVTQGSDPYDEAVKITDRFEADMNRRKGEQSAFNPMALPGFLTSFGLNLMSATPRGKGLTGLLATAGEAAKEPFKTFQAAKMGERQDRQKRLDDVFSSALASEYGLKEAEIDASAKGSEGRDPFKFEQEIKILENRITENNTLTAENKRLQEEINSLQSNLNKPNANQVAINEEIKQKQNIIDNNNSSISINETVIEQIKGTDAFKLAEAAYIIETYGADSKEYEEFKKTGKLPRVESANGGRIGYNIGGSTMMPELADAETEQVEDLSYNELRSRLPQSISNDVVQVISQSKQALLDFANIRDQQDVDEFNQRYNVSLNIAQEG